MLCLGCYAIGRWICTISRDHGNINQDKRFAGMHQYWSPYITQRNGTLQWTKACRPFFLGNDALMKSNKLDKVIGGSIVIKWVVYESLIHSSFIYIKFFNPSNIKTFHLPSSQTFPSIERCLSWASTSSWIVGFQCHLPSTKIPLNVSWKDLTQFGSKWVKFILKY